MPDSGRKTGRLVRTIRLRTEADHFAWSPDGTTLAVSGSDTKIDLWDAATSTRRATLEGHYNVGIRVAYHPAGTILASTDWSGQLRLWDSAIGRHLLNITSDGRARDHRGWQDRGFSTRAINSHYQVNAALEYRTLAHAAADPIYYSRPSVRHDGRLLAVGTNQGAVIWDLAHGTELAFLPIGYAAHLMFDASGDLITSGPIGRPSLANQPRRRSGTMRYRSCTDAPAAVQERAVSLSTNRRDRGQGRS